VVAIVRKSSLHHKYMYETSVSNFHWYTDSVMLLDFFYLQDERLIVHHAIHFPENVNLNITWRKQESGDKWAEKWNVHSQSDNEMSQCNIWYSGKHLVPPATRYLIKYKNPGSSEYSTSWLESHVRIKPWVPCRTICDVLKFCSISVCHDQTSIDWFYTKYPQL